MRSIFRFLFVIFFFGNFSHATFTPDALIYAPYDLVLMRDLQPAQTIVSYDELAHSFARGAIQDFHFYHAKHAYKINCDDGTYFITVPEQRLMLYDPHIWLEVKDLAVGDRLLCHDNSFVRVSRITPLEDETLLCEVTVTPHHTLLVTERGIIAHNFVIATVPPLVTSIWAGVVTAGVIGAAIVSFFAKDSSDNSDSYDEGYNYTYTYSPPPPKKPNDEDEFKRKHPHGRYEDVGYHKNHQSGRKGPRPINGQEALDNSFLVEDTSPRRIGVSRGQFVVLDRTREGLYHGHVRIWKELERGMQNILKEHGIVTGRGKII